MQQFIALENIKRYRRILAETDDEHKRDTVRQLLADEEARLRQLMAANPRPEKSSRPIISDQGSTHSPRS
jgi:hypothetical protein